MKLILYGDPRTKKNSQRLVNAGGRYIPLTSKAYTDYERDCLRQITGDKQRYISSPVNVRCLYYMQTKRRVDLNNLLEASTDILVKAGVLADDNSHIVAGHDGSRVYYDKQNPRVEIEITVID
jgi:Holliday junction resolvase RusA-like endonuclease